MARASKEYKNLNCKIDKEVSDKLEKFIEDTKMSKTATVERALTEFIEKYNHIILWHMSLPINYSASLFLL